MDKARALAALRRGLDEELAAIERVAAMARDEVGNAETKQEGKYDTRSTEASYLARGQAWRVAELRSLQAWFSNLSPTQPEVVALGALVESELGWLFLAPVGGLSVQVDGVPVRVISPSSPFGQAVLGLEEGDGFEVHSPRGLRDCEVLSLL